MSALFDAKTVLTHAVVGKIIVGCHRMHDRQTDDFSALYIPFSKKKIGGKNFGE